MAITLKVNGQTREVAADADTPLLYALRNDLKLNGAKFGCGFAQCGACTVHIDGAAVRSCVTPIGSLEGKSVTTLEGIGTLEKLHPLQKAFIAEQAAQCGYCTSGMIMSAKALLDGKRITSADWASYPILTFEEIPEIETHLIMRQDKPPLGTGEVTQGPTSAAIANAVYNAMGIRLREAPFTPERVKMATVG